MSGRVKVLMLKDNPDMSAKLAFLKTRKAAAARVKEIEDGIACKKGNHYFMRKEQADDWVKQKICKIVKTTKGDR